MVSLRNYAFLVVVACGSLALPCAAELPGYRISEPEIEVVGSRFKLNVSASVPLSCAKAWEVFTDFEAMPRFLPGLTTSRIVSQKGGLLLIEQAGVARYGIFSHSYRSQRAVRMDRPLRVSSVSLVAANTDDTDLSSQTTFEPSAGGPPNACVARYSAEAHTQGWIPPTVASAAAASIARDNMAAMIRELARRNP